MKIILQDNNAYILGCRRGEEVVAELKKFCAEHTIEAASFSVIGAANEVELAWYDVHAKKYTIELLKEDLEITTVTGDIAKLKGETVVHMHGLFSDKSMNVKGGHVNKIVVAAACEITLQKLKGTIERAYDEETGLNLMQ
ncbi:MAG: DNA-binding protein [Candidatus Wildermuthbacteria bacterium]|nr:DNA-binding protein [Candidatus Wildermuthbacteria bacterium]